VDPPGHRGRHPLTAPVAGDARTVEATSAPSPPPRSSRLRGRGAWAAACAVAGVALFLAYLRVSWTVPDTSDGAANALQAWDMLHGNLLLHGWTVSDVSFYTTELPEYMGVELIRGLGPGVVHVAAAFTYTLLVLLAGLLAKGRATGREGLVRLLIASGIMLAPQLGTGAFILLLSPDHTGTEVPLLVTWLVLDRAPRRWYVPVLVGLMLAWVQVADRITLIVAVAPLVLVCAMRIIQCRLRKEALSSRWYELILGAAAVCSVGAAWLAVRLIARLGGYTVLPLPVSPAAAGSIAGHLRVTAEGVLALYGADLSGLRPGAAAVFALVHLAGVVLAGLGLGVAFWRFFRVDDLVVQVLAVAIVINLAFFAFSNLPVASDLYTVREIAAVLPLGAVLAGRMLTGPLLSGRALPAGLVTALGAAVLACYVAALGYAAAQPSVPAQEQNLADWLVAHHLRTGLGGVEGNVTTLDSGGRAQLLVTSFHRSGAAAEAYQSKASWYDPRLHDANFVVSTRVNGANSYISYRKVVADFGPPERIYRFRDYTIMVWDKNLLADLSAPR
jgi:hypothetical protein